MEAAQPTVAALEEKELDEDLQELDELEDDQERVDRLLKEKWVAEDQCRWTIFEDLEDELSYHRRRSRALCCFVRAHKLVRQEHNSLMEAGLRLQDAYETLQEELNEAVGDAAYWKELAKAREDGTPCSGEDGTPCSVEADSPCTTVVISPEAKADETVAEECQEDVASEDGEQLEAADSDDEALELPAETSQLAVSSSPPESPTSPQSPQEIDSLRASPLAATGQPQAGQAAASSPAKSPATPLRKQERAVAATSPEQSQKCEHLCSSPASAVDQPEAGHAIGARQLAPAELAALGKGAHGGAGKQSAVMRVFQAIGLVSIVKFCFGLYATLLAYFPLTSLTSGIFLVFLISASLLQSLTGDAELVTRSDPSEQDTFALMLKSLFTVAQRIGSPL